MRYCHRSHADGLSFWSNLERSLCVDSMGKCRFTDSNIWRDVRGGNDLGLFFAEISLVVLISTPPGLFSWAGNIKNAFVHFFVVNFNCPVQ